MLIVLTWQRISRFSTLWCNTHSVEFTLQCRVYEIFVSNSTHCLPFFKKLNLVSWIRKLMKVSVDLSVNVNDKQSIQHTIYICIHTLSAVDTYIQVFHHNCRWIHILPHLILHQILDIGRHDFDNYNINTFKNHNYFSPGLRHGAS